MPEFIKHNSFSSFFMHYGNDLLLFPVWYFVYSLPFWYKFSTRTLLTIFDMFGVGPVLANLFQPFRRDRSFVGYLVGITIRLFWLFSTSIVMAIGFVVVYAVVLAYYVAPFYIFFLNPYYLIPYVLFWFVFYGVYLTRRNYWHTIRLGNLTEKLANQIWLRLELDPKDVNPLYLEDKNSFISFLKKNNLSEDDFLFTKEWVLRREFRKQHWKFWRDEFFVRRKGVNMAWVAGFLPELKKFSVDLTDRASRGGLAHVYGRERELEKILTVLSRPQKNNILMVGEAGVGKTSIVHAIAWLILGRRAGFNLSLVEELIKPLEGKRIIELNTGGLVGSAGGGSGGLESLFNEVLRELREGETILFVNQIENLVKAGMVGYLTPLLSSTHFPIIATTTPKIYRESLSQLSEFVSELEVIMIDPPSINETINILEGMSADLEAHNRVFFTYPGLRAVAELSERYIHGSVLPDKAINALVKAIEISKRRTIGVAEAQDAVAALSGVPVGALSNEEADKLLNLEQLLKKQIVGQDDAIREISRAIRRARTGVGSKERPIASLMFLGQTGTGKTLSAKTLAKVYFTPQDQVIGTDLQLEALIDKTFIRFDMSEFSEYGAVTTFLQRMTQAIKDKPFSLVLLDEFEKADKNIHNLFLQIFEDGRLTSEEGELVDFRNSIIIATSNAVRTIPDGVEREMYMRGELEKSFRPELINRLDGVVFFNPLNPDQMKAVVTLELTKLSISLKNTHEITITWNEALVDELAKLGYDPNYGARPLRRIIQNRIEDTLAQRILRKELQNGDTYELKVNDLQ